MHSVPNHCVTLKDTLSHNIDNKAADKGSQEDKILASVGFINIKLSK